MDASEPAAISPQVGQPGKLQPVGSVTDLVIPHLRDLQQEDGTLPVVDLPQLLAKLELSSPSYQEVVNKVAGSKQSLTQDETLAVVGLLHSSASLAANSSYASINSPGSPSKAPFKKVLTKNRSYLETGSLSYDETVVAYLAKLDSHRKACEVDGRYQEARAAAMRLADLKTAQVERLRQELVINQGSEMQEVHKVFQEETIKFTHLWDARIRDYESTFHKTVEDLKDLQEQQRQQYIEELVKKRPMKPKPSREYLNQKKIEASLVRTQQYLRAAQVKEAAEELYAVELEAMQQAFEAEQRLRIAKFSTRQKQEFEALLQRGARGRDELELRRVAETERRMFRFRNVVQELENLHRLEVVQLESFLDAQVQAGKASPIKDEGVFRRRREVLYATTF